MHTHSLKIIAVLTFSAIGFVAFSQNVGINTTGATPNAAAILDLNTGNAGTKGFLPEEVALTATNAAGPIALPPTGLLVYNTATAGASPHNVTPGYYFNAGTSGAPNWEKLVAGNSATTTTGGWLLNGNTGTNPANNFLGTTDANALNIRTNNIQRMTILSTGLVGINVPAPPYLLTVAGAVAAPIGYFGNSTNTGFALWAANTAAAGAALGAGIVGNSLQTGGAAIAGELGNATVTVNIGSAISGYTDPSVTNGFGVFGECDNATGIGTYGSSTGATGIGVQGTVTQATAFGVNGTNSNTSGTGIVGAGNNQISNYLTVGSGGFFTGTGIGIGSIATTAASGVGVIAAGNNLALSSPPIGCGGSFIGQTIGIDGFTATSSAYFANDEGVMGSGTYGVIGAGAADANYGGYFQTPSWFTYIGGNGYKVMGNGTVATEVKDKSNNYRVLTCPEAPEVLFEDYGSAQLTNGKVHVTLDPLWAANVTINQKHPLRVMITLNDPCNGVYVTNRTPAGFDVVELNNGHSNAAFTYEVIANRAALYDSTRHLLKDFADMRFVKGPGPLKVYKNSTTYKTAQAARTENGKMMHKQLAAPASTSENKTTH